MSSAYRGYRLVGHMIGNRPLAVEISYPVDRGPSCGKAHPAYKVEVVVKFIFLLKWYNRIDFVSSGRQTQLRMAHSKLRQ